MALILPTQIYNNNKTHHYYIILQTVENSLVCLFNYSNFPPTLRKQNKAVRAECQGRRADTSPGPKTMPQQEVTSCDKYTGTTVL